MAAAAAIIAATTAHRRTHIIISAIFATNGGAGKDGKQAAHFFAVTFLAHDIIGVLVADKHLKF